MSDGRVGRRNLITRSTAMNRRKSCDPASGSNQLKDEVYRQMYLLEAERPGSEVRLALALLHAWAATSLLPQDHEATVWLRQISPLCVRMIENSLSKDAVCLPVKQ